MPVISCALEKLGIPTLAKIKNKERHFGLKCIEFYSLFLNETIVLALG
jgi:hypothetical protein